MPIFLTALSILGLMPFSVHAGGIAGFLGEKATCEENVTIDQKYLEVKKSEASTKEKNVAITHLLNEALTPYLKTLHDKVTQLSKPEIIKERRKFSMHPSRRASSRWYPTSAPIEARGQRVGFEGLVFFEGGVGHLHDGPYTSFNEATMTRVTLAANIFEALIISRFSANALEMEQSYQLRKERTFADVEMNEQMFFGILSTIQSVAALTANPVADLSSEQLLREVITQRGDAPSLVVLHSLVLPPALLGITGNRLYVLHPLERTNKGITFHPAFRAYMKGERDVFMARGHDAYEFGNGCPVAHCRNGSERSGLQYFLDAYMYIYDNLGDG